MPVKRIPLISLTPPPRQFNSMDEVNQYMRELHREIENQFNNIDSVISENYEDVDGGDA